MTFGSRARTPIPSTPLHSYDVGESIGVGCAPWNRLRRCIDLVILKQNSDPSLILLRMTFGSRARTPIPLTLLHSYDVRESIGVSCVPWNCLRRRIDLVILKQNSDPSLILLRMTFGSRPRTSIQSTLLHSYDVGESIGVGCAPWNRLRRRIDLVILKQNSDPSLILLRMTFGSKARTPIQSTLLHSYDVGESIGVGCAPWNRLRRRIDLVILKQNSDPSLILLRMTFGSRARTPIQSTLLHSYDVGESIGVGCAPWNRLRRRIDLVILKQNSDPSLILLRMTFGSRARTSIQSTLLHSYDVGESIGVGCAPWNRLRRCIDLVILKQNSDPSLILLRMTFGSRARTPIQSTLLHSYDVGESIGVGCAPWNRLRRHIDLVILKQNSDPSLILLRMTFGSRARTPIQSTLLHLHDVGESIGIGCAPWNRLRRCIDLVILKRNSDPSLILLRMTFGSKARTPIQSTLLHSYDVGESIGVGCAPWNRLRRRIDLVILKRNSDPSLILLRMTFGSRARTLIKSTLLHSHDVGESTGFGCAPWNRLRRRIDLVILKRNSDPSLILLRMTFGSRARTSI